MRRPHQPVPRIRPAQLRDLRRSHGLTQDALAELLGCSRSTISTWETHPCLPRPRHLDRLTEIFRVPAAELVEPQGDPQTLKHARKLVGLRQEDIATALQVKPSTYADVENGRQRVPPRWLPLLADALRRSETELLSYRPYSRQA
ncbi:helix-turn-helix domain-containing protein [Streptomyces klenkii]|uniref:helix-turn-helix domain-containing protein n=1 Tax=Streptomyces klenkii TaxID=1420899 RepID=UPI00343FBDBA